MFKYKGLCIGHLILACTIVICFVFAWWLNAETEVDKYRNYMRSHNKLFFTGQFEAVEKLRVKTLAEMTNDKLDNMWIQLVEAEQDGLPKIQLYIRILAGNPENEFTYVQISSLLKSVFPEESQSQERFHILKRLQGIEGIRYDLLERNNLSLSTYQ